MVRVFRIQYDQLAALIEAQNLVDRTSHILVIKFLEMETTLYVEIPIMTLTRKKKKGRSLRVWTKLAPTVRRDNPGVTPQVPIHLRSPIVLI
jgi:hypothetical protein